MARAVFMLVHSVILAMCVRFLADHGVETLDLVEPANRNDADTMHDVAVERVAVSHEIDSLLGHAHEEAHRGDLNEVDLDRFAEVDPAQVVRGCIFPANENGLPHEGE
jgi:hypothetical protein